MQYEHTFRPNLHSHVHDLVFTNLRNEEFTPEHVTRLIRVSTDPEASFDEVKRILKDWAKAGFVIETPQCTFRVPTE